MKRLGLLLLYGVALICLTGWGFMFVNGGGGPAPAPTATPPTNTVQIDKCTSDLALSTASRDIPLTLTVNTNLDGTPEGMVLFHKGITSGTDPNGNVLCAMDSFGNCFVNDLSQTTNVNAGSQGCFNVDWITQSRVTGSDTVTAKNPGSGLPNAAILCTVKNFAAYDVSNGTCTFSGCGGTTSTNALTSTVSPTVSTDQLLAVYYIEGTTPSFTNASTNSTIGSLFAPMDLDGTSTFTTSSILSNSGILVGAATATGSQGITTGFQRGFTPAGSYCGGMIAITNTITALTVAPLNPSISINTPQQFSATAQSGNSFQTVTGSATWTSSIPSCATVGLHTGLATAGASACATQIQAAYKGQTAITTLNVTNGGGVAPQFSTNGQILSSYNPSTSVYARSLIEGDGPGEFSNGPSAADTQAAGFNLWEAQSLFLVNTDWLNIGCGTTFSTFNTSCAFTWWQNNRWSAVANLYTSNHILRAPDAGNITANGGYDQGGMTTSLLNSIAAFLNSHESTVAMPYIMGEDEFTGCNLACNSYGTSFGGQGSITTNNPLIIDNMGMAFRGDPNQESTTYPQCSFTQTCPNVQPGAAGFAHIPFAEQMYGLNLAPTTMYTFANSGPAIISDYAVMETAEGLCSTSNGVACDSSPGYLSNLQTADQRMNSIYAARGTTPIPETTYLHAEGMHYGKQHTGRPFAFVPGTDFPGDQTSLTPGNSTSGVWFAETPGTADDAVFYGIAHGWQQGYRDYRYDFASGGPCTCRQTTTGCGAMTASNVQAQQTEVSSIGDWNTKGCLGQDRWYGLAVVNNLIQTWQPYILQPMAAIQPGGCNLFPNNSAGNNIVCGAKQGTVNGVNSSLVIFENFSSSPASFSFNPSNYFVSGGTAQSYQVQFPSEVNTSSWGCGAQLSAYAASRSVNDPFTGGVPYDCGRGETSINGISPTLTTTFMLPTAANAPTTTSCGSILGTFSGGACSWTMQPHEIDAFLYTNTPAPLCGGGTVIPGTNTCVGAGASFVAAGLSCPSETNAQDPAAAPYNADSTGLADSSVAIATALNTGDLAFNTPGTYLVNLTGSAPNLGSAGITPPAGRKIECAAGVTLKQSAAINGHNTAIFQLTNGNNTVCGCNLVGGQTGNPPFLMGGNPGQFLIQAVNSTATNDLIENNTFGKVLGDSAIQFNTGTTLGPTNETVRYNTFTAAPVYAINEDAQVNVTESNNLITDAWDGPEWDACPASGSIGTVNIRNDYLIASAGMCFQAGNPGGVCSGDGLQGPGFIAVGVGSGNACNYNGVTIGGSAANANYCTGTASVNAGIGATTNGINGTAVVSGNILGSNCVCHNASC